MQPANAVCPVCSANTFDLAGVFIRPGHPHTMYRCRRCRVTVDFRLWSLDPAANLSQQALATESCYTRPYTPEEFGRRMASARGILEEFGRFLPARDCFVELGVGEGFLARAAAETFGVAYGLDLDLAAASNVSQQFGCPGNLRFLPHAAFAELASPPVSATALWHVLEHLPDPVPALRPFVARMTEGGVLLGQVPLLREDYVFDEHFLFYDESALLHLADALGCTPVLMQRDEENDFLSFCLRKRPAPPAPCPTRAARPALRDLGVEALFVFGHQRSGTGILVNTLAAAVDCDVLNEDHPDAFANFRLRPAAVIQALAAASGAGCLFKPITESLGFREVMQVVPGAGAVFVVRNPLEVVPSYLTAFRDDLPSLAYDIVQTYRRTRPWTAGADMVGAGAGRAGTVGRGGECWEEVDRLFGKYSGRFDPRRDAPSVVALGWLLLHAAVLGRGLLGAAGCAVVDYDDLFDQGGALARKLRPVLGTDIRLPPPPGRRVRDDAFASSVDIELARDCLALYGRFCDAGGGVG